MLASHISPIMPIDTRRLHTRSSCLAFAGGQSGADEDLLVTNGWDGGLFACWKCCADDRVDIVVGIASVQCCSNFFCCT